jgi:hypothetical protein
VSAKDYATKNSNVAGATPAPVESPTPKDALIEELIGAITKYHKENLLPSEDYAVNTLDALALVTATCLARVGNDKRARKYFLDGLKNHKKCIREFIASDEVLSAIYESAKSGQY